MIIHTSLLNETFSNESGTISLFNIKIEFLSWNPFAPHYSCIFFSSFSSDNIPHLILFKWLQLLCHLLQPLLASIYNIYSSLMGHTLKDSSSVFPLFVHSLPAVRMKYLPFVSCLLHVFFFLLLIILPSKYSQLNLTDQNVLIFPS